jgi:hypothetical protein
MALRMGFALNRTQKRIITGTLVFATTQWQLQTQQWQTITTTWD